jgi:hypothetical protein
MKVFFKKKDKKEKTKQKNFKSGEEHRTMRPTLPAVK